MLWVDAAVSTDALRRVEYVVEVEGIVGDEQKR